MSFIATAPDTVPDAPPGAATIRNDGWFPDIDMAKAREALRLDGTVTNERLRRALVDAMFSVNSDLKGWQVQQKAAGHSDLAAVPAMQLDGVSVNVSRYQTAVYCLARASVTERYRSFDSTKSGHGAADELDCTIDDDRRDARFAVRDILGVTHVTVELL
ncbi:head completion/stabilization protein [Cupriavidus sp. UGS-1]|uniref:head completion/stabilization protein n=1 Tax=Cupriavidus sp. UGS-1 TaxID=2899826 RepID=UPI001E3E343D|nr:head completion/stabilization protein [Cupriavidus sp. UGS-1]MCD9124025.1 head completion/stabilization protein [Cupriavidus sp. UGS-1]